MPYRYQPPVVDYELSQYVCDANFDPEVDLVKITCSPECVYVRQRYDGKWIVDPLLIPCSLIDALEEARTNDSPNVINDIQIDSAVSGNILVFRMAGWTVRSLYPVTAFRPTHRNIVRERGNFQLAPPRQ